jgi:O-acetyl-ADP-ribose deacetylase (regulator of RNase III)
MANLIMLTGDATDPISHPAIIVHICNDYGAWGRGFVMALSKRWAEPEARYRAWSLRLTPQPFTLGQVQFVEAAPGITVANMLSQHGLRGPSNPTPLDYGALRTCLQTVFERAHRADLSLHMPRIGCGLGGGSWSTVESIISEAGRAAAVDAIVYI